MTDHHPPLSDEDLSALLDGMADPAVVERVRNDPDARARVEALRAAGDLLRKAPIQPLADSTVDSMIDRALTARTATDGATVTPLAPRRAMSHGAQRWLVAAAVVALVAVGLGLVWNGTRGSSDQDAASTPTDANAAANHTRTPEDDASEMPSHGADGPAEAGANSDEVAELDDLGSFGTASELRMLLRGSFPDDSPTATGSEIPTVGAVNRCTDFIHTAFDDIELAPKPDEVGYAEVEGRNHLVYEFSVTGAASIGETLITVADPASCDLLFTFVR